MRIQEGDAIQLTDLGGVDDRCALALGAALVPLLKVLVDHPKISPTVMLSICGVLLLEPFAMLAKSADVEREVFLHSLAELGGFVFDGRHRSDRETMQ